MAQRLRHTLPRAFSNVSEPILVSSSLFIIFPHPSPSYNPLLACICAICCIIYGGVGRWVIVLVVLVMASNGRPQNKLRLSSGMNLRAFLNTELRPQPFVLIHRLVGNTRSPLAELLASYRLPLSISFRSSYFVFGVGGYLRVVVFDRRYCGLPY